jgi:hypothetical protein
MNQESDTGGGEERDVEKSRRHGSAVEKAIGVLQLNAKRQTEKPGQR